MFWYCISIQFTFSIFTWTNMNWTANNHLDRIQFSKAAVSVFLTRDWWHKHKYPHQTGLAPDLSVRSWCNTHTHTSHFGHLHFPILCLSIFLSLSLWMRSWQLAANVCHHSAHFSAWQGSVLGHTHTPQSVSSRLAGGSRVEAARKIPKYLLPNFSQRKNYLTLYKLSVCVCVSQLTQPGTACGWQSGIVACHQGGTWSTNPVSSWPPLVVTYEEAGGGLAQRLLLHIAATCFSHLLFTFPPSLYICLFFGSELIRDWPHSFPLLSSVLWVRQIRRRQRNPWCYTTAHRQCYELGL